MVVPPLMEAIRIQVEVEVEGDELDDDSDIDEVEVEGGYVAIRTSAVEEQATGCQMMVLLAEALQQYFYPYLEEVSAWLLDRANNVDLCRNSTRLWKCCLS